MADADRIALSYAEEDTYGVLPATPEFTGLRLTSESLKQDTATTESNEINPDRQTSDIIRTGLSASGDIALELSYETYDEMFEFALFSAGFSPAVNITTNGNFSAPDVDGVQTISGTFAGFNKNQWIRITNASNDTNNGVFKLLDTASGLSIRNPEGVAETGTTDVLFVQGGQATNGTTMRSFTLEKEFTDLTEEFVTYPGSIVNTLSMSIATQQVITGSVGIFAKREDSSEETLADTLTPAPTTGVMNAVDDVFGVFEDGRARCITTGSFQLQNNLRQRLCVGTLGAKSIGSGKINATGSFSVYFESKALMDKYRNFDQSSLAFVILDSENNSYVIEFPAIKYTDGAAVATGTNSDIVANMSFSAFKHPEELITMRISKFEAPAA